MLCEQQPWVCELTVKEIVAEWGSMEPCIGGRRSKRTYTVLHTWFEDNVTESLVCIRQCLIPGHPVPHAQTKPLPCLLQYVVPGCLAHERRRCQEALQLPVCSNCQYRLSTCAQQIMCTVYGKLWQGHTESQGRHPHGYHNMLQTGQLHHRVPGAHTQL